MKKKLISLVVVLVMISLVFAGCATDTTEDPAAERDTLKLGYVQWACANANSHMVEVILEENYGVDVELVDMEAGLMWQAVGTGDIDFMVTAWLPNTHAEYLAEVEDDVVVLSPLYDEAKTGLVVPSYVTIDSIEDMNANADKFDGQITGIDAGAGIMADTAQAVTDYEMTDLELVSSSGAAMTAELKARYEAEEWVVVTGWSPHWMWSAFDLKYLEDPLLIYGEGENINAVTRAGFGDEYPEINTFLDTYFLTSAEFGDLISYMEDETYADDSEAAKAWIADNQELVDSWM